MIALWLPPWPPRVIFRCRMPMAVSVRRRSPVFAAVNPLSPHAVQIALACEMYDAKFCFQGASSTVREWKNVSWPTLKGSSV